MNQIKLRNTDKFHYLTKGRSLPAFASRAPLVQMVGSEILEPSVAKSVYKIFVSITDALKLNNGSHENSNHELSESCTDWLHRDRLSIYSNSLSSLLNKKIAFLRGWDEFQSCVKGFNAIGLMAEQVSYHRSGDGPHCFSEDAFFSGEREVSAVDIKKLINKKDYRMALELWSLFHKRPIVCSTSTNMGIALHEILIIMRDRYLEHEGKYYPILTQNEGRLVIWAPDRRADFMSKEKADTLQAISEIPNSPTTIRTYIDRRERDPGAFAEAYENDGFFFPTNPQSKLELQDLIVKFLGDAANDWSSVEKIYQQRKMFFKSIGVECSSESSSLRVTRGIEGGIYGLMHPVLSLWQLYEDVKNHEIDRLVVWNQASIGAALAAGAIGIDLILTEPESFKEFEYFGILKKLSSKKINIVGAFDIANMQSLAQLLGVIVEKHVSGKGVPFVGLGSSSYSNGNLCYDVLSHYTKRDEIFQGNKAFFPLTHSLNVFSQAILLGVKVKEIALSFKDMCPEEVAQFIVSEEISCKPESAGAAAFTAYILSLLDGEEIDAIDLAYLLRNLGFNANSFRQFLKESDIGLESELIAMASGEGPYMRQLIIDICNMFSLPASTLKSMLNQQKLDQKSANFKDNEMICIYLTGNNTRQPSKELLQQIIIGMAL